MSAQPAAREDDSHPDHGWKPKNRPQSTAARNFMTELDSLFKLDGDIDTLDKTLLEKKQAVTSQTEELEALERKLRETENRLKQAKSSSPPRRKDNGQRRNLLDSAAADHDKAPSRGPPTRPLAYKQSQPAQDRSERPRSAQPVEPESA